MLTYFAKAAALRNNLEVRACRAGIESVVGDGRMLARRCAPAKIQLSAMVRMKPSAARRIAFMPVLVSVLISTCACFNPVTTTRSPYLRSASRSSTRESVMR